MQTNPRLKDDEFLNRVADKNLEQIRNEKLRKMALNVPVTMGQSPFFSFKNYAAAAGIALLITFGVLAYQKIGIVNVNQSQISAGTDTPIFIEPNDGTISGSEIKVSENSKFLKQAIDIYNSHDPNNLTHLKNIETQSPSIGKYFTALYLLKNNKPNEALQTFDSLIDLMKSRKINYLGFDEQTLRFNRTVALWQAHHNKSESLEALNQLLALPDIHPYITDRIQILKQTIEKG